MPSDETAAPATPTTPAESWNAACMPQHTDSSASHAVTAAAPEHSTPGAGADATAHYPASAPEDPQTAQTFSPQTPDLSEDAFPEHTETTPLASPVDSVANKHYSTLSFTRTVPNDVNWDAEDDEGEWTLSRANTDPFQFMPLSERTNSFPAVPPLDEPETASSDEHEHPLPSSQAMDIIQEVDNEVSKDVFHGEASEAPAPAEATEQFHRHEEDASFFDGTNDEAASTEPEPASTEAPSARYEEGLPLIANDESPKPADEPTSQPENKDLFAETDGDKDDDFFKSTSATAAEAEPASFTAPAFERKSTMQVLQSMNVGDLAHKDAQLVDSPVASPTKLDAAIPEAIAEEPTPSKEATTEAPTEAPKEAPKEPAADASNDVAKDAPKETTEDAEKPTGDLAAKWAEVFDDEDELLDEAAEMAERTAAAQSKELDPAAFFGDDDEGFLEDVLDAPDATTATTAPAPAPAPAAAPAATTNRYLPQVPQTQAQPQQANPYLPSTSFPPTAQPVVPNPYTAPGATVNPFPAAYGYDQAAQAPPQQQQPRPTLHKAQSFADKSKGGYSSPYDLPLDVVRMPRKRQSLQQLSKTHEINTRPPRSSSLAREVLLPPPPPSAGLVPPPSAGLMPPPTAPAAAAASTPTTGSFFEDLPIIPKSRPVSRHSQQPPAQHTLYGMPHTPNNIPPPPKSPYLPPQTPSQLPTVPPPSAHYAPPAAPAQQPQAQFSQTPLTQSPATTFAGLVAPPKANPYAALQPVPHPIGTTNLPPPVSNTSRYSPSPNQLAAAPSGPPPASRYSPAPPSRVPSATHLPSAATPPILPHQPRTSSPLAHFELSYDKPRTASAGGHVVLHGEQHLTERRSSASLYEARLNRVSSLPPTREEEEDQSAVRSRPVSSESTDMPPFMHASSSLPSHAAAQYSPQKQRHTPPPPANAFNQATLSPPKRVLSYVPAADNPLSPPQRSQTQSPGSIYRTRTAPPAEASARPSSSHSAMPPPPAVTRPRAPSLHLNLVPPTDGTETDPLQRWKGGPICAWGAGGAFVSSFPQDIPRYGINQAQPTIYRTAGEVQVKHIKEIQPLDERLAKFPGPLKGKSKKKEVLAWLTAGIEGLEQSLRTNAFSQQISLEDKRLEERVLLWKILRLLIEHDGVLEGTEAVTKAVRGILVPGIADEAAAAAAAEASEETANLAGAGAGYVGFPSTGAPGALADAVDSAVVEKIRKHLLLGEKEKAAWGAVDKRLWGHALLIASADSRELFKKVAQEFVRKEVNTPGLNNESLAAFYEVLSGNHEESVDELVPVHARAGLQLMTAQPTMAQVHVQAQAQAQAQSDGLAGLDKWRETLSLMLSNRCTDDVQAMNALGNLLAGYGRAEAAHVCYVFSRSVSVFGGLDDPAASFVLVGADHKGHADSFANETDAVLLSEVYEYGLSLASSSSSSAGSGQAPHLAAYKLQHAMTLADYGQRDRALQYCEAIAAAMTNQTRRSPYYHAMLEAAVEDLMKRLKSAPNSKDESSSSWIPKPSMNKVSDTMWNRFNKFVAGDEVEGGGDAGAGGEGAVESGPFARIASGTPTISRPTSSHGLAGVGGGAATGMEMFGGQILGGGGGVTSPTFGSLNGVVSSPPAVSSATTRAGSRYAPGGPVPVTPTINMYDMHAGGYTPMSMSASGMASPPSVTSPYEPGSMAGFTPLGLGTPVVTAPPSANPYEPVAGAGVSNGTASPYAPSSRRVSADGSTTGEPAPYLPRSHSELSPGYSPYAPGPGSAAAGLRPSLSRKSSYTPLAQVEPAAPVTSYAPVQSPVDATPAHNPYAPAAQPPVIHTEIVDEPEKKSETESVAPSYGYQAPSYGYEPPSMNTSFEPASDAAAAKSDNGEQPTSGGSTNDNDGYGGYEAPSYQPYSYEPPSYEPEEPDAEGGSFDDDENAAPKPKKKSFLDDDEDDVMSITAPKSAAEKSREEKDRENAEMFRKIAEEEEKRAAAEKEAKAKKGWGLTSWWGKKDSGSSDGGSGGGGSGGGGSEAPKAVRAKLGEKSSFYFDPELKRWVNKNASPEDQAAKSAAPPPPPRSIPGSARSTPPPPMAGSAPTGMGPPPPMGAPPGGRPSSSGGAMLGGPAGGVPSGLPTLAPPMMRTSSGASTASGPPSRPTTSMSEANSIDDLLGAVPGPRKGGKKSRKSGRYVDVMAK